MLRWLGRRWFAATVALLAAATALLIPAGRVVETTRGPSGRYFAGPDWQGSVIAVEPHAALTTESLKRRAQALGREQFSAIWTGTLTIGKPGTYAFALASDDGSWLFVDDRLVIDNGGVHAVREAKASPALTTGPHTVVLRYAQHGGDLALSATLTDPNQVVHALARAVTAGPPSPHGPWIRWTFDALPLAWSVLVMIALVRWAIGAMTRRLRADDGGVTRHARLVLAIVVAVAVLALLDIGWGLPARESWAPDELPPSDVIKAIARGFSGGWFYLYPPAQFYLLSLLYAPFLAAHWLGLIRVTADEPYLLLYLIARAASAVMAAVTAGGLYLTARELGHSRRAATFALVLAASGPVFVYYARVANVDMPYVMWYAMALSCYARILRRGPTLRRFAVLGVLAALAVGTKDQAYGFFVFIALHLVWRNSARAGERGVRRLWLAATDACLWTALLCFTGVLLAIHNVLWNRAGFLAHLELIAGPGSQNYRMFEATVAGQIALLSTALQQFPWCMGWPAFGMAAGGLWSIARRRDAATAAVVLLPIVSCYVCFLAIVGYHYDRYFLGPCLGMAMLSGIGLDLALERIGSRALGLSLAAAVIGFTLLYGMSVPILMHADSRYAVERWLARRLPDGAPIVYTGPLHYLPRLDRFSAREIPPVGEDLRYLQPAACVANWQYARRFQSDPAKWSFYQGLEDGRFGYRLAARIRSRVPTLLDLVARQQIDESNPFTNLNKLNPEIRVYERTGPPARSQGSTERSGPGP